MNINTRTAIYILLIIPGELFYSGHEKFMVQKE